MAKKRKRAVRGLSGLDGVLQRARGSKQHCGCELKRTSNGRRIVKCAGASSRFVSEKDALHFQLGGGSACAFIRQGKKRRSKRAKRR